MSRLREALAKSQPISIELVNYRSDGSSFCNALFIGPVFDGAGALRYFLGNQLDVTAQMAAQEALQQKYRAEAVGQLATGMAHVLTNLLQTIISALELMAPKFREAGIARHGARALHAARDAAELIHQLLAFARKTPLIARPLDLAETVKKMQPVLDAAVAPRRLELALGAKTRRVLIDRAQFEAALLRLVINAREAVDARHIVVRANNSDLDGVPAVSVSVEDDGGGMTAEVLERAMEPFFTTKASPRNRGMGLSMASGFVAQSWGRLELQSAIEKGARAVMRFPATLTRIDH